MQGEPMKALRWTSILAVLLLFVCITNVQSAPATEPTFVSPEDAHAVIANWFRLGNELNWGWNLAANSVADLRDIGYNGEFLGYLATGEHGFIVVPAYREFPPITAYSTTSSLDLLNENGLALMLKEALSAKLMAVRAALAQASPVPEMQAILSQIQRDRNQWTTYSEEYNQFKTAFQRENATFAPLHSDHSRDHNLDAATSCAPLLTTAWHQSAPYNNLCPMGDGGRCVVGCVATATAQILAFWKYPVNGVGNHSFTWGGDYSCGGATAGQTLSATFSDSYDWANMSNSYSGSETQAQRDAVAELCYEVGVAFDMDYGRCGSGTATSYASYVLPQFFGMASDIDVQSRSSYNTADSWFAILQDDLNRGWPIQYRISSHSIVCDGWQVAGSNQIHLNYGWADSHTAWYTVDNLYCTWSGCSPQVEYCVRHIHPATGAPIEPNLTVTSPNGGETTTVGTTMIIGWTISNVNDNVLVQMNRSFPIGSWETLANLAGNTGSCSWLVTGPATTNARIRIVGVAAPTVGDTSNANFSIVIPPPASLVLVSPNGGETFARNAQTVVRWTSNGLSGQVRIEANFNYPGGTWSRVANSVSIANGSYTWRVGTTATSSARIRITSLANTAMRDTSDANFTILGRDHLTGAGEPVQTILGEAYPNPFNPSTIIHYQLSDAAVVILDVFDVTGRLVERLVNQAQSAGDYQVNFDAAQLSMGTYFLQMQAGNYHSVQKLLLLK
jgi:hypothetical protein